MTTDNSKADNGTNTPTWRSDVYGILHHADGVRVWLVPLEDGWSLPYVQVSEPIYQGELARVTELMGQLLQLDVIAYRYADYRLDETNRSVAGVYVIEQRGASTREPAQGQWQDRQAISSLVVIPHEHGAVLDAYFAEAERGAVPRLRPPWAQPGWFRAAEAWIEAQLVELGYQPTTPVEQVRCWSLSCVLRAKTTTETLYFKTAAALPSFGHEPALMKELSRWYPDHIPQPLCVEHQQRWMLLADWGEAIGWEAAIQVREQMYRTLARLQVDAAARVDQLLTLGCIDRRLHILAAQVDPLLEDDRALSLLDDAERTQLRLLGPRLKSMCDELAAYNLPATLVHGDLHPGNVTLRAGNILIFDWTDACVTHPFFDLMHLFHAETAVQTKLRENYFELWTGFEPIERLREAWTLAAPLCALHHTISYQWILNNIEENTRDELASGLTFFGHTLLELMSAQART